MSAGYVYILINPSFPDQVKIGKTFRDSRQRARKLSTTGLPTPFQLIFDVFSLEHELLEEAMHFELAQFRVSTNREFFRYPIKEAIELLLELRKRWPSDTGGIDEFAAQSIFDHLTHHYSRWLRPTIIDVQIVQTSETVWLEITEERREPSHLNDQIITRSDLSFICGSEGNSFLPSASISDNVAKFISIIDPYSIINTTNLFHDEACQYIDTHLNPHRK